MAPHHPKNKLFYSPKDSFPTILDYLTLSPQATGDILRSLETHPDRNAEAKRNAIQVSFVRPPLLPLDGTPGFAIASNYTTAITDFMVQQSGDIGRDIINEQKKASARHFSFGSHFGKALVVTRKIYKRLTFPSREIVYHNAPSSPKIGL